MATSNAKKRLPIQGAISSSSRIWEGAHRTTLLRFCWPRCDSISIARNEHELASTQQGAGIRRVQHFVQQKELRGSRAFLVAQLHPAQRSHRACSVSSRRSERRSNTSTELVFADGDYVIVHRESSKGDSKSGPQCSVTFGDKFL